MCTVVSCMLNALKSSYFILSETPSSTAFNASITQLWQDVQERLVYRAYIFIKTDINDFSPHDGDLLYPEKLEMMLSIGKEDSTGVW